MNSIIKLLFSKSTRAGSWYIVGNLLDKAVAFLTIPIFTRILTPIDYGLVNTYISWVGIMTIFVGLSFESSIRTAYTDFKKNIEEYLSSVLFLSLINFLILTGVIILSITTFKVDINIWLVIFCLFQSYMIFVLAYITNYYMMQVKYIKRTLLLGLPNVLNIILSIILMKYVLQDNLYMGRIISQLTIFSIFGILIYIFVLFKGKKLIDFKYWRYAITISLPLIMHILSISILSQSDRIMITEFKGPGLTGIYSLVYNFGMILTVFHVSLEGVWVPRFTKKMGEKKKDQINSEVIFYIDFMVILAVGLLFISPELLSLMAPQEYWSGKYIIPPILLSSFVVFLYSLSVNIEYYYKKTSKMAMITLIAAVVNILLNFIFIPLYGATGAAYTTLISYLVSFGLHFKQGRKLDKDLFPFKIYLRPLVTITIMTIIGYVLLDYVIMRYITIILFVILYLFIMYKKYKIKNSI